MDQRVSLITLGVADLAAARAFYEALGWACKEVEETVFVQAGGSAVVLWGREKLAADAGIEDGKADGFGGVALAQNVRSREEVDAIMGAAEAAGARITKPADETFTADMQGISPISTGTCGRSRTTRASPSPTTARLSCRRP